MTTVIIPAHNEAAVIGDCLHALLTGVEPGEFDVIVACNGCSDDTAERARRAAPRDLDVVVLEIEEASKIAALNASIEAASRAPVVFLDADVRFSAAGVRALRDLLDSGSVLAAAPALRIDFTNANWISRSYHRFWVQVPSIADGLAGRGVYALSTAGLERLNTFPNIIADDRFVHSLFTRAERATLHDVSSAVAIASTARATAQRKARVFAGNREIADIVQHADDDGSWTDVLRRNPRSLLDAPAYLVINFVAKLRARRTVGWNRDESSRSIAGS